MNGRRVGGHLLRGVVALASVSVLAVTGFAWTAYRTTTDGLVTSAVLDLPRPVGPPSGPADPAGLDDSVTALLVGIDSRTDAAGNPLPPEVLAQLRAGADEGQFNTDSLILLHIPAGADASVSAVSLPRDSFVSIAGDLGRHKINSAYRRGMLAAEDDPAVADLTGPQRERALREAGRRTLVETVQELTGVTVDHYAELNLLGFVEITDALGGVPVCLNTAVREPRSGVDLPAGQQVLRGSDALAFVRQRHDLPDGDLDRVERQQAFLAGLARSALGSGALTDPMRLESLMTAVTRYVVLDQGWDLEALAGQLGRAAGGDIAFRTIPTGTPALETPVDGVAVEVDPDAVRVFVRDTLDPTLRERITSRVPGTGPAPALPPDEGAPDGPVTEPVDGPTAEPVIDGGDPDSGDPDSGDPLEPSMTAETVPCVD